MGLTQDPHALQWMLGISCLTNIIWMVVAGVLFFGSRGDAQVHEFVELPGIERVHMNDLAGAA